MQNASVFLLKQVLHDWSDAYASTILTELRKAASKDTRLVVIDNIISYACHDSSLDGEDVAIAGAADRDAPAPLLPNFGAANDTGYIIDMVVRRCSTPCYSTFILTQVSFGLVDDDVSELSEPYIQASS